MVFPKQAIRIDAAEHAGYHILHHTHPIQHMLEMWPSEGIGVSDTMQIKVCNLLLMLLHTQPSYSLYLI